MSLSSGTKLAHYEILELIGKGEVYRARDGKLGRDVAIKVLPDEFAKDEERAKRFQREAKVLASLNHPNIASIYGLEHSNDTHFPYVSDETGREEIYLRPYPGEGGKRSVSPDGGTEPLWSSSGRELFYRNGDKMMAVRVETEAKLRVGTPEVLFEGRFAITHRPDTPRNYDVSRDGQRFLMVQTVDDPAPTQINIVLNWFEELERLVPTN